MNYCFADENNQNPPGDPLKPRKPYHRPKLEVLGDLRTMTLGTSPTGNADSGGGAYYEYNGDKLIPNFPPLDEFKPPEDPYYPPL